MPDLETITDALRAAQKRGLLPTTLGTAELRELGADVLARSVFTARGSNAVFVSKIKEVVDAIAAGDMSDAQARAALGQTLDALVYDSEAGGFPDDTEVPKALRGTLQDLRSNRRLDLIVRTQRELMQGAGEQWRGQQPDMLAAFPAWELIRVMPVEVPRDWPSRWTIAGGQLRDPDTGAILDPADFGPLEWQFVTRNARMIAAKGDPVWGDLGSYENFNDALGVDHPPFAFNSGMGWRAVSAAECADLGVTGPDGTPAAEWVGESGAVTTAGTLPKLPDPRLSLDGVDPQIIRDFEEATQATQTPGKPASYDFSDLLAKELKAADAAYGKEANP